MTENYMLVAWILAVLAAGAVIWAVAIALLDRLPRRRSRGRRPRRIDLSMWEMTWKSTDTDQWMAPLRSGGTRAERRIRQTFADRGLLLVRRAGRRARRALRGQR
ncbi:hypothetical protein Ssi03_62050 [Sphaerisporangium siamense]|uniref:Uncharacterized protein n=1 Tax=Sphaerisporangium siamense TaxID=795645 RepID=A0A7W7DBF5_9ACTN|nr:hypothetical protein [Sphaerisporangium siamense]MBB4702516.1 hypothetical protein [Sphaerisporangium siamense]GII88215.1 hypothetical protein Ssi03_62050 [Sphaerisporangium siamense]